MNKNTPKTNGNPQIQTAPQKFMVMSLIDTQSPGHCLKILVHNKNNLFSFTLNRGMKSQGILPHFLDCWLYTKPWSVFIRRLGSQLFWFIESNIWMQKSSPFKNLTEFRTCLSSQQFYHHFQKNCTWLFDRTNISTDENTTENNTLKLCSNAKCIQILWKSPSCLALHSLVIQYQRNDILSRNYNSY